MNIQEYREHLKRIREDPQYREKNIENLKRKQKEDFPKIKPFNNADDVPELPNGIDPLEWKTFYVPIIIEKGGIPKDLLIEGAWYYGDHRRCYFAKWDGLENEFKYVRQKFNQIYWDTCNHFEDDDGYALFVPLRLATQEEIQNQLKKIKN